MDDLTQTLKHMFQSYSIGKLEGSVKELYQATLAMIEYVNRKFKRGRISFKDDPRESQKLNYKRKYRFTT